MYIRLRFPKKVKSYIYNKINSKFGLYADFVSIYIVIIRVKSSINELQKKIFEKKISIDVFRIFLLSLTYVPITHHVQQKKIQFN